MLTPPDYVNMQIGDRVYMPVRAVIKFPLSEVDAVGMAFSAVRDESWTSIPLAPANDTKARVLDYPTTAATLNFAAVAAQSYRIWKDIDRVFANECLAAAKAAWTAALRNPAVFRYGEYSEGQKTPLRAINEGGGAYADTAPKDAKAWAATELYLAQSAVGGTDSAEAQQKLKDINAAVGSAFAFSYLDYAESFSWKHNKNMGLMSLLVNGRNDDIVARSRCLKPKSVRR
ncbi:MAG: glycoside hydrolase family 9 protein [Uliginosibacterium sp.]|nr:glycoside hydrolase family 9 protein [Uliginosibacterium sp.]